MRHQKAFRKFSRSCSHRDAMFRNMATSLLRHERIETTVAKAKDLRRVTEKLITLGKDDSLHHRRQAYSYLYDKAVVHKLFADIGPRYSSRPGGYTRVIRTRRRFGDAAEMAVIELVQEEYKPKKKKAKKKAAPEKKEAADSAVAEPQVEEANATESQELPEGESTDTASERSAKIEESETLAEEKAGTEAEEVSDTAAETTKKKDEE